MKNLRNIATSTVIGTFLVIAITGVLMFFKIKNKGLESVHEWLGVIFVIAGILHVIVNWKAFSNYFKKFIAISFITLSLLVSAGMYLSTEDKPHPAKTVVSKITKKPVKVVAPALGINFQDAIKKLRLSGIKVESPLETLNDISKKNKLHPFRILEIIMNDK